jgi:serine/threonine protein kinase
LPEYDWCLKSTWPHQWRGNEGEILSKLQDVRGVVKYFGHESSWNKPYLTTDALSRLFSREDKKEKFQNKAFEPRIHRYILTEYVPFDFGHVQNLPCATKLEVWKDLFRTVDALAGEGWVHRDISWNNVRIRPRQSGQEGWETVLIDFDLAARIEGVPSGLTGRTGIPIFMPLAFINEADEVDTMRHQELHELESAFWVGLVGIIASSQEGAKFCDGIRNEPKMVNIVATKNLTLLKMRRPAYFTPLPQYNVGGTQPESSAQLSQDWQTVQQACLDVRDIIRHHEEMDEWWVYPALDEKTPDGTTRLHKAQYDERFARVIKALSAAQKKFEKPEENVPKAKKRGKKGKGKGKAHK